MIKKLSQISNNEKNIFGNKAVNLSILQKNNFAVPRGICLSTQIKKLDKKIKSEILEKIKNLKFPLIVRSSSPSEDSSKKSFAGIFFSSSPIFEKQKIFAAIEKCWRAATDEKIKFYSRQKIKMSVILQEFIEPDFFGVAFSADPISGNSQKILTEICSGRGEKLVSGKITPEKILFDKKYFFKKKWPEIFTEKKEKKFRAKTDALFFWKFKKLKKNLARRSTSSGRKKMTKFGFCNRGRSRRFSKIKLTKFYKMIKKLIGKFLFRDIVNIRRNLRF